tara:strand:+ start:286 stop:486 length:201 start_codon:yes stop_codon:yes gene_type:complete
MRVLSLLFIIICFSCEDRCKCLNEDNIKLKKYIEVLEENNKFLEENNKFLQEDNNLLGSILAEREN